MRHWLLPATLGTTLLSAQNGTVEAAPDSAPTGLQREVEALLGKLDAALNRGSLSDYFALFAGPRHPQLRHQHSQTLKPLLQASKRPKFATSLRRIQVQGPHRAALVRRRLQVPGLDTSMDAMLGLTGSPPRVLFYVEVDPAGLARHVAGQTYRCRACNYQIAFGEDWLSVPQSPRSAGCMEGHRLISMRHDLYLEVAIHVGGQGRKAAQVLSGLVHSCGQVEQQSLRRARLLPWQALDPAPAGSSSAQTLTRCKGGYQAKSHLLCHGPMQYLLVAHGSTAAQAAAAADLARLLQRFSLLDPGADPSKVARRAIQTHTGGALGADNRYHNRRHGLRLDGPRGWQARAFARGHLFELHFRHPGTGSSLHIRALAPDFGAWAAPCRDKLRAGLRKSQGKGWTEFDEWCADDRGFHHSGSELQGPAPGQIQARQLACRRDLLLVIDSDARSKACWHAIRRCIDSLR